MKFINLLVLALFLSCFSLLHAQQEKGVSLIPEEDVESLLASEEEELIGMRLLAFEEEMSQLTRQELEQESRQARNLKAQIRAEIAVLQDENQMLTQQIEKLEFQQEKTLIKNQRLHQEIELLLSENDELMNEEEEDEIVLNSNLATIKDVEKQMQELEATINELQTQIDEAEEAIEQNDDQIDRHEELYESCEMVIQSNLRLLNDMKK